jgi:hypothetical protein
LDYRRKPAASQRDQDQERDQERDQENDVP